VFFSYNHPMFDLLLILITGIATGFLNVMAGGGSMLSVPIMIFLGIPSTVANATNRIAILPQNITASIAFYRQGMQQFGLSLSLAACTLPGALLGAYLAANMQVEQFNLLLAIIMLFILGPVEVSFLSRDRRHFFGIEAFIWTFGYSQRQMENKNSGEMATTLWVMAKIRSYFVRNNLLRVTKHYYFFTTTTKTH